MVLLLMVILCGVGALNEKFFSSQASHLHGVTFTQVSFEAFQNVLPTSLISAPIQMFDKLVAAFIVPVMVSELPALITVLIGGVKVAIVAPAGTLEVTVNKFKVAGPALGLVIVYENE